MIQASVFILAAGSARRFNGTVKQLLPVNGEPIIRRMIRQVREHKPDAAIYIVTWHPELMFPDVNIINTILQPEQLAHSMLWSEPYWGPRNIFLLGDVIFGDRAIQMVLDYTGPLAVFGREKCPVKDHSERFSLSFAYREKESLKDLCHKTASLFRNTAWQNSGGLRNLCLATQPYIKMILTNCVPFRSILYPLVRPVRDFILWHILGGERWKPGPAINLVLIDDDITTDIDTPEDYAAFLEMGT